MNILSGKRVIITAGPTREYIDPVRYISNDSSGQMGLSLAEAAGKMGARVRLIHGPISVGRLQWEAYFTHAKSVRHLQKVAVTSAQEMLEAVRKYYKKADIIIMAAAVADWRPVKCRSKKIKKNEIPPNPPFSKGGQGEFIIKLVQTPDILAWLGTHKLPHQMLVGFALETENLIKNAKKKLRAKKCDYIIANHAKAIGAKKSTAVVISKNKIHRIKMQDKAKLAKQILTKISSFDIKK